MNQGRRPARRARARLGAYALTLFGVSALATGGVAPATTPRDGGGPPEHAQGNGKPADTPPATQQTSPGQAKREKAPAGGQVDAGADAHGKSGGGHDKARGNGHTSSGGGSGETGGGSGETRGHGKSIGPSEHAKAGKVTLCHATGSATNPYVMITISANAVQAHERHQDGRDIIPAPAGGCPGGGSSGGEENGGGKEHGKVTLCHATGSETNPYVVITISENALDAHLRHQHGQDIYPVPAGGCPSTVIPPGVGNPPSGIVSPPGGGSGEGPTVLGVSEGSGPAEGENLAGEVLGANQGGAGDEEAAAAKTGSSLPFTGLGLGLLTAIGLALALGGRQLRRSAS